MSTPVSCWVITCFRPKFSTGCDRLPIDRELAAWIGEAARLVCEGELRQVLQRDVLDIDEATYHRDDPRQDCGTLSGFMSIGSQLRLPWTTTAVIDALGVLWQLRSAIAFQMVDDYLDLWGDGETIGKTLGTDIASRQDDVADHSPAGRRQVHGNDRLKDRSHL